MTRKFLYTIPAELAFGQLALWLVVVPFMEILQSVTNTSHCA